MERIQTSTKSVDKFGAGKHGFTNGNPSTGTPSTQLDEAWCDSLQEEIANTIEGAGLTLNLADRTQLRQAITAMVTGAQKAVIISSATFEASVANGEVVRWDSGNSRFDEAIADGTANDRAVGIADVTNSKVYIYGECPLFSGLTPGARYYLDASTAGAVTATAPADGVAIGIAKSATTLFVDIDALGVRTDQNNTFSKAQSGAYVTLADGATITPDFALANKFRMQLGGNRTLANPTNLVAGQEFEVDVYQDNTGSRTLAYAWGWQTAGGSAPSLSTTARAKDKLVGNVDVYAQSAVTISIATPGVVIWNGHGLMAGQQVQLTTTSALPTGLSANTTYYVVPVDANSFHLSATQSGTAIATSGSQSGVHTMTACSITYALVKGVA